MVTFMRGREGTLHASAGRSILRRFQASERPAAWHRAGRSRAIPSQGSRSKGSSRTLRSSPPDRLLGEGWRDRGHVRRALVFSNSPLAGPPRTPSRSDLSREVARSHTPAVGRWPFGAVEPALQDSARPALPRPPEALPCSPRMPHDPRGTPRRSGARHCAGRSGEIQGLMMALWAGKRQPSHSGENPIWSHMIFFFPDWSITYPS